MRTTARAIPYPDRLGNTIDLSDDWAGAREGLAEVKGHIPGGSRQHSETAGIELIIVGDAGVKQKLGDASLVNIGHCKAIDLPEALNSTQRQGYVADNSCCVEADVKGVCASTARGQVQGARTKGSEG